MAIDFSLKKYEKLIRSIREKNIDVYGIAEWLENNPSSGILSRHDVDRKVGNALKIAQLESNYKIKSTFYFRMKKGSFDPEIITKVRDLGHEIGYHYENLSSNNGNYEKAISDFEKNLEKLREYTEIKTIAMHGKPLSRYDNKSLWDKYDFRDFGIIGEAFLTIDYSNIYYFTDTGRSWGAKAVNLRDKVNTHFKADVENTDQLIDFIKRDIKIALVTHPERWNESILSWLWSFLLDKGASIAKVIINTLYNAQ